MQSLESKNEEVSLMQKDKHDEEFEWLNEMATDLLGGGDAAGKLSGSIWKKKGGVNLFWVTFLCPIIILEGKGREPRPGK